jgi:hypothetical protein
MKRYGACRWVSLRSTHHTHWIPAYAGMIRLRRTLGGPGVLECPPIPFSPPKIEDPHQEEWGLGG